jgi:DNA primase
MNVFERLRECVDLFELADRFTELRPSGNTFCGCCPFPEHQDNTPSFYCYLDQRFHCFGCGRHGDAVDLWAAVEGIEPSIEAALDLAQEYGVELPEMGPEDQKRAQERREREARYLREAEACHEALAGHARVGEWWERRGFGKELRERYLLGANGDGTEAIIPFWNRGRVKGLIRRKLEGEPKYVYPRAEEFSGGHRPLFIPTAVRAGAFLVEGIVDALALGALGDSAIATGGTAISQQQMRELKRLPGPLYILPDADESGAEAAREWARELYPKALVCPAEYGEGVTEGAS